MDPEKKRKEIQNEILKIMELRLREGKMDAKRAQEIARYVIANFKPNMTIQQLNSALGKLDDSFPELVQVVVNTFQKYEDTIKSEIDDTVARLVKEGKMEEAQKVLKNLSNISHG